MLQSTARVGSAEYRHGLAHQGLLGAVIRLEKEHLTLSYSLRFINLTSTDSFLFVIAKVHQDMPTTFLLQNGKYGTFSRSPFVLHPATNLDKSSLRFSPGIYHCHSMAVRIILDSKVVWTHLSREFRLLTA